MDLKTITTIKGTPLEDILRKIPEINEYENNKNKEIFRKYGTSDSMVYRHRCVLCNKKTCIDDSMSSSGNRLICIRCVHKYFDGDYGCASYWCGKGK